VAGRRGIGGFYLKHLALEDVEELVAPAVIVRPRASGLPVIDRPSPALTTTAFIVFLPSPAALARQT
jgi:hypothetical protein